MNIFSKLLDRIRRRPSAADIVWREGIVIQSADGPVPEKWRRQAVINMRLDPAKFMEVERVILKDCGGDWEKTKRRMRAHYPEACPEDY